MKNSLKIVCFLVTILLIVGGFVGCGANSTSVTDTQETTS